MTTNTNRLNDIEAQLVSRALQDADFRDRLVSDPKGVLAAQGLTIPDEVQIQVLQESATQYYLVLPSASSSEAAIPLSDRELEAVAGGLTQSEESTTSRSSSSGTQNTGWTGCASGQAGCVLS